MNKYAKSIALSQRAHQIIPGAAHTYAKGDDQFPEEAPRFIERGHGCHVWDIDGNEFIEYGMGLRAVTLGHGYEPVVEAAYREMKKGVNFSRPSPIEVECAEKILDLIPCGDMAKFAKNGSDVTTAAVKLARAYTGRNLVVICRDHPFFSVDDWFMGQTNVDAGIPDAVRQLTLNFSYNDLTSLELLFEGRPDEIACVVMEVEKENPPLPGYLQSIRALCSKHGSVLVFDEIITGFRIHLNGGQGLYGVTPDLATFGKALGNGFPIAALAGKKDIMELGGLLHDRERVFLLSTTSGAETSSLAAALKIMEIYEKEHVVDRLYEQGDKLAKGVSEIAQSLGIEDYFGVLGRSSNMVFYTRDCDGQSSQPFRTLFMQELIRRGVIAPSFIVSFSHSDEDIQHTINAVEGALEIYKKAINNGGVDGLLVGQPVKPVYRRYN